jgi:hypothetical protein
MSREGEARRPALLEPPKRSPRSSLLPTVSLPCCLPCLSAVCRSAATASPPVRADVSKSTASQGRARRVGLKSGGALVLALTAVLRLGSCTEAATSKGSQRT